MTLCILARLTRIEFRLIPASLSGEQHVQIHPQYQFHCSHRRTICIGDQWSNNLTARARSVQPAPVSTVESDRVRDGLVGPVRRV